MKRGINKFEHKVYGRVRYITYYLIFGDNDYWVDQRPLVHDIKFEIQNMKAINKDPDKVSKILKDGEVSWKDHNGIWHKIIIEEEQRQRKWGVKRH